MATHSELVQYQKKLSAQSEPLHFSLLPFPLGPLGIPDMKFLDIPKDFSIDHLIGVSVFQFFDTIEKTNLSNPRKGKTIKDIQKLTGAEILFLKGNQGRKPKKLEIRGSLDDVKLAEKLLQAFFKHPNPEFINGLNTVFLSEIWKILTPDSISRKKIEDFIKYEMI